MITTIEEKLKNAQVLFQVNDFTDILREVIREELDLKNKKELEEKFLSPEETCKLFNPNITKPTLDNYFQKNLLKKYFIGGRTWYKYSEVIEAVKEIKRFSRNN